jgi:DNA-binding MarR family transcriptional regulator
VRSETRGETDELATRLIAQAARFTRSTSRAAGMTRSLISMRVLSNLSQDGDLRVGELAAREAVTQPAITATVNRLEEDGLVHRHADPDDARAALVAITEAGRHELGGFRRRAAAAVSPALTALSRTDRETLRDAADLLDALATAVNARWPGSPLPPSHADRIEVAEP